MDQEKIKEIMSEFDNNQRKFLGGLLHSTEFNKWQEKTLQEYGNYIRQQTLEEAIGETLRALETKYAIFHHSNLIDSNGNKIDGVKEYENLQDLTRYVL